MDTRAFEYQGVKGHLTPITNRSEMMVTRMVRVLLEGVPGLSAASMEDRGVNAALYSTSKYLWRFTNLARIVDIEGLAWTLPGPFATPDEILAAWQCFQADNPDFWEYLGGEALAMDAPDAPPEARPDDELTEEERKDPNFAAAATTTTQAVSETSKPSSGGANRRRRAKSSTITTGTPS